MLFNRFYRPLLGFKGPYELNEVFDDSYGVVEGSSESVGCANSLWQLAWHQGVVS